jgi:hypothetical protein
MAKLVQKCDPMNPRGSVIQRFRNGLAQFIVGFSEGDTLVTVRGRALKVIPLGNASLQVKFYEGTATVNLAATLKQFSASPSYNLSIVNTDNTNELYFSFDGNSIQGHLRIGEFTTLAQLPVFTQIYLQSSGSGATTCSYKMWIW